METSGQTHEAERRRYKRNRGLLSLLLLSPYLIIFLVFTLIPCAMGVVMSFMRYNPYLSEGNEFIGFENYINLFKWDLSISRTFWQSFGTMLLFDLLAVPCMLAIPLVLAYFINMQPPGYKFFRAIIYLPSVVSISIVGILFGNLFAGTSAGLINAWLNTEIKWLSGRPFAGDTLRWLVMLLASIWWQTGTNFVIFSGALRDVPKSLYEACEMDGASRFRRILCVTLPNIRPALTLCLFNTLIGYLNLYGQPFVLNDYDNEDVLFSPMMFIQKYLQGGIAYAKQTGYFCAAAIVFGLIVMAFSTVQQIATSEHRRVGRHSEACRKYLADKRAARAADTTGEGGETCGGN